MSDIPLLPMAVVVSAGVAIACQAPINAALGRSIGSGVAAAGVSFGIGFAVLVVVAVLIGQGASLIAVPGAPPFLLIGGALGAFFVWSMLWSVPIMGVVTATAALILGQMCAALVLDAIGAFGLPKQPVSLTRLGAVLLVAAGLVLSRV